MRRSSIAIIACAVALWVDSLGLALRAEAGALRVLTTMLEALLYGAWFAVLLGLTLGRWLPWRAPTPEAPSARADAALAYLPLFSLWALGLYFVILFAGERFHNRELSALLVVCLALGGLLAILPLGNKLARALPAWRAHGGRRALLFTLGAALITLSVIAALTWHNLSGLRQLSPWLFLSPAAGAACYLALRLAHRRHPPEEDPRWLRLSLLAAALSGAVVTAVGPWSIAGTIARQGAVSRLVLLGLRTATDVDRDGYSSLWGGGDCQAFNAAVHPAAKEIPGDGVDNNCIGGDGGLDAAPAPPTWRALPAALRVAEGRPSFLVVTVETLRADAVGFARSQGIGAQHPTTPKLDAYAERSVVFERFFATTPWTRLSLPTLFSSLPPSRMDWRAQPRAKRMRALGPDIPWAPELLQKSGYHTIAVLNSFRAFTSAETAGFERGFKVYDTSVRLSYSGGTMRGHPGAQQVQRALLHLDAHKDKPFFLWVHLMEPHYLYQRSARAPHFGDDEQGLYASEVWETDQLISELLQGLEQRGLSERTVVTVVGDHGEEFQEHGERWHGSSLKQPQVHTVGLMHVPGAAPRRVQQAVSHEDLAPTWLNLAGIKGGYSALRGRNLTPLFMGEPLERDHFFLERFEVHDGSRYQAAIVEWPLKLIYTEDGRQLELYDLESDPDEQLPAPRRGQAYEALERLLLGHIDGAER